MGSPRIGLESGGDQVVQVNHTNDAVVGIEYRQDGGRLVPRSHRLERIDGPVGVENDFGG